MKKILSLSFLAFVALTLFWEISIAAECWYNWSITDSLRWCLGSSDLVDPWEGLIETSIKEQFITWTTNLTGALSLIAIGAIVYGGLMMTISVWEDEKIKKWKDIVKWALIWFLWAISAWAIVRLVVEVVFRVGDLSAWIASLII